MLGDLHFDHRHVAHLPHDHPGRLGAVQAGPTAAARGGHMLDHLVRIGDPLQRRAGRAGLLTRPACRTVATLPPRLAEPSDDGGSDELPEFSPSRRDSSATYAASASIRLACSSITLACSATTTSNCSRDNSSQPGTPA